MSQASEEVLMRSGKNGSWFLLDRWVGMVQEDCDVRKRFTSRYVGYLDILLLSLAFIPLLAERVEPWGFMKSPCNRVCVTGICVFP